MFEIAACDQCGARRAITGVEQKEKLEDEEQRGSGKGRKCCVGYEDKIPRDIGRAKHEVGILGSGGWLKGR